jgi:hypothetical protein
MRNLNEYRSELRRLQYETKKLERLLRSTRVVNYKPIPRYRGGRRERPTLETTPVDVYIQCSMRATSPFLKVSGF